MRQWDWSGTSQSSTAVCFRSVNTQTCCLASLINPLCLVGWAQEGMTWILIATADQPVSKPANQWVTFLSSQPDTQNRNPGTTTLHPMVQCCQGHGCVLPHHLRSNRGLRTRAQFDKALWKSSLLPFCTAWLSDQLIRQCFIFNRYISLESSSNQISLR